MTIHGHVAAVVNAAVKETVNGTVKANETDARAVEVHGATGERTTPGAHDGRAIHSAWSAWRMNMRAAYGLLRGRRRREATWAARTRGGARARPTRRGQGGWRRRRGHAYRPRLVRRRRHGGTTLRKACRMIRAASCTVWDAMTVAAVVAIAGGGSMADDDAWTDSVWIGMIGTILTTVWVTCCAAETARAGWEATSSTMPAAWLRAQLRYAAVMARRINVEAHRTRVHAPILTRMRLTAMPETASAARVIGTAALAWALRTALDAQTVRILLLRSGNVHPHPGPTVRTHNSIGMATLNAPGGLHVLRRDRTGAEHADGWGDGWDLLTKPAPKLQTIKEELRRRKISLMVVTETRLHERETAAVTGHLKRAGYEHRALAGSTDTRSKQTVWGVSVVWDPEALRLIGEVADIVPHRVLRARFEVVGAVPVRTMTVYGAYMPQRSGMDGDVIAAWGALTADAERRDAVWIMGDMNAETREMVNKRGGNARMTEADVRMEGLMRMHGLYTKGTGRPTHRAGTEIDHIIVNETQAASTDDAKTGPGVCGKDHNLVWTRHYFQIDATGQGPARAVGPRLSDFGKMEWGVYETRMSMWMARMATELNTKSAIERAREIQDAMLRTVETIKKEKREHEDAKRRARDPKGKQAPARARTQHENAHSDADVGQRATATGAGTATKGKILHLFSGPHDRKDGLAAKAAERGYEVVEVDTLVDAKECDLTRDTVFGVLRARAAAGEFIGAIIGTPCSTFTVARLHYDPDNPGPTKVRSREGGQHRGLKTLTIDERTEVERANLLVARSAELAEEVWRTGGSFIIENPMDRGVPGSKGFQEKWREHAPLWMMEEIVELQRRTRATTVSYPQCAMGGAYQKYTTLMYSREQEAVMAGLALYECTHAKHVSVARGWLRRAKGWFRAWKSARAAAYPAEMNDKIIDALTYMDRAGRERAAAERARDTEAEGVPQEEEWEEQVTADGEAAEMAQWDADEQIANEMDAWHEDDQHAVGTGGRCPECEDAQDAHDADGHEAPRQQRTEPAGPSRAVAGDEEVRDAPTPTPTRGTPAPAIERTAEPDDTGEAENDGDESADGSAEDGQETSDDDGEDEGSDGGEQRGAGRRATRRRLNVGVGDMEEGARERATAQQARAVTGDEWEEERPKGGRPQKMRWRVQRWMHMHAAAMRYNGARWVASAGNRKDTLMADARTRAIMTDTDPQLTYDARRRRVRELCERQIEKYTKKMKRADDSRDTDEVVTEMREVLRRTTNGSVIKGIFDVIQRACGKRGREGAAKLTEMMGVRPGTQDDIVRGAARVREEAQWYGQQRHRAGQANPAVAKRAMNEMWAGLAGARATGEGLARACSWEAFETAVVKCQQEKGVGVDGWNAYLLRKSPVNVRRAYWECLVEMIQTMTFPTEYKQWVAMLAIKGADENPRDLARRRDLWIVCHGQKIIMRMLNPEYERAAEAGVPLSQSGYARGRGTTEQVLVARLAAEQQMREQKMMCVGFMDCGTFFMSCVRTVQRECEEWVGVDPGVSAVVRALHTEVTAQYETAHGCTEPFDMDTGNGQGCVNGAVRSKLQFAVVQRAIERLGNGYGFRGYGQVGQLVYADDALYIAETIADLQMMFDTCWMMMTMMGLQVMIKGKSKTAFMATYWESTQQGPKQRNVDMGSVRMRLPDGRDIPQICADDDGDGATADAATRTVQRKAATPRTGVRQRKKGSATLTKGAKETRTYRYLGCEISPFTADGYEPTRREVTNRMVQIFGAIGRIPGMDNARMCETMDVAVQGVMGYFGRATPFTWGDCERMEQARAYALRLRGFSPGVPKLQIYAEHPEGGLGHHHVYRVAAAALMAQVDRALSGADGEPQRAAVQSAIVETCKRLGCRGESPLTWEPAHVHLDENNLIEAWLLAKRRTRMRAVRTATPEHEQMIAKLARDDTWADGYASGPMLWESGGLWGRDGRLGRPSVAHPHARRLAAAGIVHWADVTDGTTGELLQWGALRTRHGVEKLAGAAAHREYTRLCKMVRDVGGPNAATWETWRQRVRSEGAMKRRQDTRGEARGVRDGGGEADVWAYRRIVTKRRAPRSVGDWEYLVEWEGCNVKSWVPAYEMRKVRGKDAAAQMQRARMVPESMYARLQTNTGPWANSYKNARTACVAAAPGPQRKQPTDTQMQWLIDEMAHHVDDMRGDTTQAQRNSRATPDAPTAATAAMDTNRWREWQTRAAEMYQTYYAGSQEMAETVGQDGRTEQEKRPCMSLTTSSARDAQIPAEERVTAEGQVQKVHDDEADLIVQGIEEDLQRDMRTVAEGRSRGGQDAAEGADDTDSASDADVGGGGGEDGGVWRTLLGGIRGRASVARTCGRKIARIAIGGVAEAARLAREHRPGALLMPANDPQDDVEHGMELPDVVGRSFWRNGGGVEGYAAVMNNRLSADPVNRLWQRSVLMEDRLRAGARDSAGTVVKCDAEGCKILQKAGFRESWRARWMTLSLHFRHHFTHAAATDASLQHDAEGRRGVAIGIWSGVQPDYEGDTRGTEADRVGRGLWGMAVPSNWEIADAEMYAILRYLRHVVEEDDTVSEQPVAKRRVLVLSDCKPAMQQIEDAWRRGRVGAGSTAGSAAMLEEICEHRAKLDRVVIVYTPGHRGISPNEYADAAAKAHAWEAISPGTDYEIARHVRSRPCVYSMTGERTGLCTRSVYESAGTAAREWVTERLGETLHTGLLLGHAQKDVWTELVTATGRAARRKRQADADETVRWGDDEQDAMMKQTVGGACGFTHGMRAGELENAEHSGRQHENARIRPPCAAGCKCRATIRHVVTGACRGTPGRGVYVERVNTAMERVAQALPSATKSSRRRRTTTIDDSNCPCRQLVLRAQAATAHMRSTDTGGTSDDEWVAMRDVLAGVLPRSVRVEGMEKQAKAAAVQQMASAIYTLQREVMAMMVGRWEATREQRAAAEEREQEYRTLDTMTRAAEAEWEAEDARAEAERRAAETRTQRETEARARQATSAEGEVTRRATARMDGAVAETRATRKRTAQRDTACATCCERAHGVCRSCTQHVQELCEECLGSAWTGTWCRKCTRIVRRMCENECLETLRGMCDATCRRHAPGNAPAATTAARTQAPEPRKRRQDAERATRAAGNTGGHTRTTAAAVADPRRWRRGTTVATGVEIVEFDTDGSGAWETRFYIKKSDIAGRGLFAARPYAAREYIAAYMGVDLGGVDTTEGTEMRTRLAQIQRADHVMVVNGRYVDGRTTVNGVQYINAGLQTRSDNAQFHNTGSVTARENINEGQEILYAYGAAYWKRRDAERRRGHVDTRRGGFMAYSMHDDGDTVFVEELVVSPHARGHGIQAGRRLFAEMLGEEGARAQNVHLIVWAGLEHAVGLYQDLGFEPQLDTDGAAMYVTKAGQVYMVASVAVMAHRLAQQLLQSEDEWETEVAAHVDRLRDVDARWVSTLYEEAHEELGDGMRWSANHAHEARHLLMWHGQGVMEDIHARDVRRREDDTQTTTQRCGGGEVEPIASDAEGQGTGGDARASGTVEVNRGAQVGHMGGASGDERDGMRTDTRTEMRGSMEGRRGRKREQGAPVAEERDNASKAADGETAAGEAHHKQTRRRSEEHRQHDAAGTTTATADDGPEAAAERRQHERDTPGPSAAPAPITSDRSTPGGNNATKPAARPRVVTGAPAPAEVTHAFTLSDPTLAWLILSGVKDLENRMTRFQTGWYAVHVGKGAKTDPATANALRSEHPDMPDARSMPRGCVYGLCYIAGAIPAHEAQGRRWYVTPYKWAHTITAVVRFREPVGPSVPGNLGAWPLKEWVGPVRWAQRAQAGAASSRMSDDTTTPTGLTRANAAAAAQVEAAEGAGVQGAQGSGERAHTRPGQWDALLDLSEQAYASYTWLGGRWVGALFARRTLPARTKVVEYSGPLMSEAELRAVPTGGNQYMLDARRVGDLQDVVTIDGTPRGRGGNIAGYANYAHETVANAAPSDEAHRPPSRHTGETYVVIRTTERVLAGTEIRWDYDMGEQTRTYRAQLQAEGAPDADLDGAAYKRVRWAPPAELTVQQDAAARARRAGHATDTQRTGPAGGGESVAGRKRRNTQSRWEGGTGAPGMGDGDGTQPQQGPTKRRRGGSGAT